MVSSNKTSLSVSQLIDKLLVRQLVNGCMLLTRVASTLDILKILTLGNKYSPWFVVNLAFVIHRILLQLQLNVFCK